MDGRREISIPLRSGALAGTLYQARGAESGVVLLDGVGAALPEVAALYDELAVYLQGSRITVLRAGYRQPRDLVACTYDVLGALDAAHTWGVERAALVVWAFSDSSALQTTAEGAIADVATAAVARTTGGDRGPVRGIATIVSAPDTASKARPSRGDLRLVGGAAYATTRQAQTTAPPSLKMREVEARDLAIALEGEGDLRCVAGPLLSQLYGWSRKVLLGTTAPRTLGGIARLAPPSTEVPALSNYHDLDLRVVFQNVDMLLGEDWEEMLERLTARDPDRAACVRTFLSTLEPEGDPSIFRRADHVWLLLDHQAREEWLHACTAIRALVTAIFKPARDKSAGNPA